MSRTKRKHPKTGKPMRDGSGMAKAAGSCEHHGGCPYCEGNRTHAEERQVPANEPYFPRPQLMTQFVPHAHEGSGDQCERCGLHRKNRLAHPTTGSKP